MVQAGQDPGIKQTDARTLRISLIVGLVEPLENLLQLPFRDAAARVGDGDLRILAIRISFRERERRSSLVPRHDVEGQRHPAAGGREFHRVGHQVHHDLLDLVHIGPHREGILQPVGGEFDPLGTGIEPEQVRDAGERCYDVALGDLELQFLVADAVEIQELVHQGKHPGGTALDDAHQLPVLSPDAFRCGQLGDRSRNHGERGAELVGHVGEVVHLDLVQPLLLGFLLFGPFPFAAFFADMGGGLPADAADVPVEGPAHADEDQSGQGEQQPGPPGSVPGRQHFHVQRFLRFYYALVVVRDPDLEPVLPGRKVCVIGLVVVPGIDPVPVEPFHHIEIVRPLLLAVIQGGEGDAEGVLVIADEDVRSGPEFPVDGTVLRGLHQGIVDFQVLEHQRDLPLLRNVQRIEPGEPMGAAEHQRPVRKDAGGPLGELVPADAVGLEIVHEPVHGAVIFAQAVHRGHPDVALPVFLDGADVLARDTVHGNRGTGLVVVPEESVGDGPGPQVTGAVLEQGGRYQDGAAYDGLLFTFAEGKGLHFVRIGIQVQEGLSGRGDDNASGRRGNEVLDDGPYGRIRQGDGRDGGTGLVVAEQVRPRSADPDASAFVLGDGQRVHDYRRSQHLEPFPVEPGAEYLVLVREQQPQVALRVAEDLGAADVADVGIVEEGGDIHAPENLALQVVNPQTIPQSGDPQPAAFVQAQGGHGFPVEGRCEELVAVELVLVMVGDRIALVRRPEPQVLAAVLEDGPDLRVGNVERETGVVLEKDPARSAEIAEHALSDDIQQERLLVHGVQDVDVAADQPGLVPDRGGKFFPSAAAGVEDAQPPHAGHPVFPVPGVDDVIDDVGCAVGCRQGKVVRIVAFEGSSAVRDDPEEIPVQDGVGETEGVQVPDDRPEMALVGIELIQVRGVAHEEPSVGRLPEAVDAGTFAQGVHPVETAVPAPAGHTVIRPGPERSLLVQEDGVHLVVGKAQRIVRSKVLVVFVDAELVEPPARRNPDMPVGVFGEGVHFLVGQTVGNDGRPFRNRSGCFLAGRAGGEQEDPDIQ